MNFETLLNAFDTNADDDFCASLTPSFCPEIIALLNTQRIQAKKTISMLMPAGRDYGFDEHAHGLA